MNFKIISTIVFVLALRLSSQAQIPVFADYSKGDTTSKAIDDLVVQLSKSGLRNIQRQPLSAYKGQGIVILQRKQAAQLHISYPAALNKYGPEGIYIKGTPTSVTIIGNAQMALQPACYFYLEQLGYRYLMPGTIWEQVPALNNAYQTFTVLTQPDFEYREIANGHGYYNMNNVATDYNNWAIANKFGGSFFIRVGHAYDEIVATNKEIFRQHPEWFAQKVNKGDLPADPKFNVANGGLVKAVVEDAYKRIEQFAAKGENINMLSMEMSDGPGYCQSPECLAIGGATDQAYYLSNAVVRELRKRYPNTWVGALAYSEHMMPPKIALEPKTYVMVTGAFNPTSYTVPELIGMWSKKASKVGIYDYIGVYEWDNDIPGQGTAAKSKAEQKNIQAFYKAGARTYLAESTMGWVARGPGQYVISKLLWDRNADVAAIRKDFFIQAYGNVAPIMQKLYDNWENYPYKIAMENDMGNWLEWVKEAADKASTPLIRQRINEVKMYLHYVALYRRVKMNPTEENLTTVMRFAYRNMSHPTFATLPTIVSLPNFTGFPEMGFYRPGDKKYTDIKTPSTAQEIDADFRNDLASIRRTPEIGSFKQSNSIIRLDAATKLPQTEFKETGHAYWGNTSFVMQVKKQGADNWLELTSGFTEKSGGVPVRIKIYPYAPAAEDKGKPLLTFAQDAKNKKEKISLSALKPGTYTVEVTDPMKMFTLIFAPSIDFSILMLVDQQLLTTSAANLNNFFFYVPKGTKNFRISKTVILKLLSPAGRSINYANDKDEVFNVEVKPGEEGLWIIYFQAGSLFIDGVPPYLGTDINRMLVPSYLKNQ
jgi:hypothetical protein